MTCAYLLVYCKTQLCICLYHIPDYKISTRIIKAYVCKARAQGQLMCKFLYQCNVPLSKLNIPKIKLKFTHCLFVSCTWSVLALLYSCAMYIVYCLFIIKEGDTPLYDAVRMGHHEVCLLLLQKGADVNWKNKVSVNTFNSEL